jgi:hypothetical protein
MAATVGVRGEPQQPSPSQQLVDADFLAERTETMIAQHDQRRPAAIGQLNELP